MLLLDPFVMLLLRVSSTSTLFFLHHSLSIESRSFFLSKKKLRSGLQWLIAGGSLHLETVPFT